MTALHSIGLYDKLDQVFGNHNKEEGIHNKEEGITDVDGSLTLYSLIVKNANILEFGQIPIYLKLHYLFCYIFN